MLHNLQNFFEFFDAFVRQAETIIQTLPCKIKRIEVDLLRFITM